MRKLTRAKRKDLRRRELITRAKPRKIRKPYHSVHGPGGHVLKVV